MNRYAGRRFAAFLVSVLLLTFGLWLAPTGSFPAFATAIASLFTFYVGGQSATDWAKARNGAA